MLHAARAGFFKIPNVFSGARANPKPGLQLAEPELQMTPRESRLIEVGWGRGTMVALTRFLGQGLFVGDYFNGDEKLDVVARGGAVGNPRRAGRHPAVHAKRRDPAVSELVEIKRTAGPNLIRRLDRRRTVTLELRPPPGFRWK